MEDGRQYSELATGTQATIRPLLRFRDVYKWESKLTSITNKGLASLADSIADDRHLWSRAVIDGIMKKTPPEQRRTDFRGNRQLTRAAKVS